LLDYRQTWGEHRVYFRDGSGGFCALPAGWTDAVEPDPFVVVSRGRAFFTARELTQLAALVAALSGNDARKANSAVSVKQIPSRVQGGEREARRRGR
jgi:hypothetical protein